MNMKDVAEIVMKQDGLSWNMNDCIEEHRESARYYFTKETTEYQIALEVEEEGIEWTLYSREEGTEDWYTLASDFEEDL